MHSALHDSFIVPALRSVEFEVEVPTITSTEQLVARAMWAGEPLDVTLLRQGREAWNGVVYVRAFRPSSEANSSFDFTVHTKHAALVRLLTRLAKENQDVAKHIIQEGDFHPSGDILETMTPDSHQFYVGSPNTHTTHQWAKRTKDEAIKHAEELAVKQGKPQYVVQVIEIVEPKTSRRKPKAPKKGAARGKKA